MRRVNYKESSMICPFCGILAQMNWQDIAVFGDTIGMHAVKSTCCKNVAFWKWTGNAIKDFSEYTLIFPLKTDAPPPNADMPEELAELYKEAMRIKIFSSRGAAAILRLCLQKICNHLAGKNGTIADNLKALSQSADPIPPRIMKAAQAVRVIGNEAVHPGVIDFDDSTPDTDDTVNSLFELINLIVENQITQLKRIDSIIARQPHPVKDKILNSPGVDR